MSGVKKTGGDIETVTSIKGTTLFGISISVIFLGGFLAWSLSVPLSGAVIANGQVVTDDKLQIVRHERGGVLEALHVREGQKITAGQSLATLSRSEDRAAREELVSRVGALSARQVRLTAEQNGKPFDMTLDDLPTTARDLAPRILNELIADQKDELNTRRAQQNDVLYILTSQKRTLEEQKSGLESELSSLKVQLESLNEDVRLRKEAKAAGLGRETVLRELERQAESARGSIAKAESSLLGLGHQMNEIDLKMTAAKSEFLGKVSEELSRVRAEKLEALEALTGRNDALARVDLKAPVSGIVNKININTVGSAVEPFAPLFEIIAEDQPMLVEVRILPPDIDDVYPEQHARVVLSAFNRHIVDPVDAKVTFVASDARIDEATRQPFFTVRLAIDAAAQAKLPSIVSGMPAEAFLLKHERTFADYLVEPFVQSFERAFRQ